MVSGLEVKTLYTFSLEKIDRWYDIHFQILKKLSNRKWNKLDFAVLEVGSEIIDSNYKKGDFD